MTEIIDIVFQMCIQREPNNYSGAVYDRVQQTTETYFKDFFRVKLNLSTGTKRASLFRRVCKEVEAMSF